MIKRGKKGQIMGMPFQFIFSLILIAVAMFVAFWAIRGFMERAEQANIGSFVLDVKGQNGIGGIWEGEEAEMTPVFTFSTKFNEGRVCFANLSATCSGENAYICDIAKNTYFYTEDDGNFFLIGKDNNFDVASKYGLSPVWKIEHINITTNPVCYPVAKGRVTMNLTKGTEYGCSGPDVCVWEIIEE
jgi:hypothetical protein